jgi:hypothetical protein
MMPNEQFLTHLLKEMKGDCELREQRLSISGGIGAEFTKEKCPDGTLLKGRFYLVDDRLYQLIAAWPAGPQPAETNRYFESFRLLQAAAAPATAAAPSPTKEAGISSVFEGAMKRFPDGGADSSAARTESRQQRQAAAPPTTREPAANLNWGALAIDVADSEPSYGIGGGDSESKASDNAMHFCRRAGGKSCKVVVSYNQCAAYAASRRNAASGKGATQKEAEAQALQACNDRCRIVISDCN